MRLYAIISSTSSPFRHQNAGDQYFQMRLYNHFSSTSSPFRHHNAGDQYNNAGRSKIPIKS